MTMGGHSRRSSYVSQSRNPLDTAITRRLASAPSRSASAGWNTAVHPHRRGALMTHRSILLLVSLTFVTAFALAPVSAHAAGVPCAALTHAAIADTTITSATIVAAA